MLDFGSARIGGISSGLCLDTGQLERVAICQRLGTAFGQGALMFGALGSCRKLSVAFVHARELAHALAPVDRVALGRRCRVSRRTRASDRAQRAEELGRELPKRAGGVHELVGSG